MVTTLLQTVHVHHVKPKEVLTNEMVKCHSTVGELLELHLKNSKTYGIVKWDPSFLALKQKIKYKF
jgi:hypothetical protein